jgi:siroheme synthase
MPGPDYAAMAARLVTSGFASETPCAIISRATTPQQQIHQTTISQLHRSPTLAAPVLLVVGEVVKFADRPDKPAAFFPGMDNAFETVLAQSFSVPERPNQEDPLP